MGQYYRPIFLDKDNKPRFHFSSYDFKSGSKLMEHSWMKNPFVRFVEKQLINNPQKLVWAGDYADNEAPETISSNVVEKCVNAWGGSIETRDSIKKEGANLYSLVGVIGIKVSHDEGEKPYDYSDYKEVAPLRYKYLVNHDKKEFVNKSKTPKDGDGWQIHPLPLLTCEGNNRGGGDFRGDEKGLVGAWARNTIEVVSKKTNIPTGYEELIFDLTE